MIGYIAKQKHISANISANLASVLTCANLKLIVLCIDNMYKA